MNGFSSYQFLLLLALLICACSAAYWHIADLRKKMKKFFGEISALDTEENLSRDLLRRISRLEARSEELDPHIDMLEKIATTSIQKVGFIRFNPFQDTGGDNSFILVLLDHTNSGILLSSLYMREGVRVYAKSVDHGTPKHALSEEEKKILEETLHKK